jgi:hypothetical protein
MRGNWLPPLRENQIVFGASSLTELGMTNPTSRASRAHCMAAAFFANASITSSIA